MPTPDQQERDGETGEAKGPERAHTLILKAGGDTAHDLAGHLYSLAHDIESGRLSTGCSGGATSGSIYSYKTDLSMTHDEYFLQLDKHLKQLRVERDAAALHPPHKEEGQ